MTEVQQTLGARRQRLTGIALMCLGVTVLTTLDAFAKVLVGYMSTVEVAWARFVLGFLLVFIFVNPVTRPKLTVTNRPLLQVLRAACLIVSNVSNWIALHYLQLDEAMSIQFCSPFFVAALAGPLLGEWIDGRRWAAIVVGFCGVLVVTRPGFGGIHPAALLTVISMICYSLFAIITRLLARADRSDTTLFYTQLVGALVLTVAVPFAWTTPDSLWLVGLMLLAGLLGSFGQYLMIAAHRLTSPAVLSPFSYIQVITTPLLGFFLFGNLPNQWTIVGAGIVTAAGLYLLYCERPRASRVPATQPLPLPFSPPRAGKS